MKKLSFKTIFLSYLKKHRLINFIYCVLLVIITFILVMYEVPHEVISYCYWIIGSTMLVYAVYDIWKYYQKQMLLSQLSSEITVSLQRLPDPCDAIEMHYQNLLEALYEDKYKMKSQVDAKQSERMEYHTLWAHQIKTPIAAIKLLMQSDSASIDLELTQELFKIEQYVDMVLYYLRIDCIASDLLIQNYQLSSIVKESVKKYASVFIYKKVKLELEEINCRILTDEKWLLFVMEQLLSNALKYTNKGCFSIYMDKEKEKTLVIQDTGIGIQEEDLPRIFENGYTGYNGRMNKKSTGIGLFLCQRILHKLSHQIAVTSVIGKGTKVAIDFSRERLSIK